jgi:surface antigen
MNIRTNLAILGLSACSLLFSSCASTQEEQGEIIGGVVGGIIGAQIGEGSGKTVATIVGAVAGSMIGRHIGQTMDENDRAVAARTLTDARTGQTTHWVNPDNGNVYEVTPTRTFESAGAPCREFTLDATVGGTPGQQVYGTACLQADGSWALQP